MAARFFISVYLILCLVCTLTAQEKKSKKIRISPLPVVYYSPETRLGFGVLLALNTNLDDDSLTTGSYFQSSFIYTLNKQYEWSNTGRIYFPQNKRIVQYRFYYAYFPEFFHGYQTQDPETFKELIEYNRLSIELRHYWKIKRFVYAGIFGRVNRIFNVSPVTEGTFMTAAPPGYTGYTIAGFAPAFHIDSRDSQVFPRKGFYLELLYGTYAKAISDYSYSNVLMDIRYFKPVGLLKDDVVAMQFLMNLNSGTVPFRDMADVGGSRTMRGYYTGYYRYKNLFAFQVEYRFMVSKLIGFATWAGACASSEDWTKPFRHSIKPNGGIGFRLRINQRDKLNLRADYGVGKNQSGLYLDAAEAF
jgi:outer membrane protein assembly factor BamA